MPRLSQSETMLLGAIDDLRRDWLIAAASWNDRARQQFEKEFIDVFLPAAGSAVSAMSELTLLLRRVVRECS